MIEPDHRRRPERHEFAHHGLGVAVAAHDRHDLVIGQAVNDAGRGKRLA